MYGICVSWNFFSSPHRLFQQPLRLAQQTTSSFPTARIIGHENPGGLGPSVEIGWAGAREVRPGVCQDELASDAPS